MRRGPSWETRLVGCVVALAPFACTGEGGDATAAGERVTITREAFAAAEGAVLLGRVAPADGAAPSAGRLLVLVNGEPHVVPLSPDGSFLLRGLPTGELTVKAERDELPGAIVIDDAADGELLEVSIAPAPGHLKLELTRRAPPAPRAEPRAGRLELVGSDVVYHLGPGTYESVVVRGERVTVLGAQEGEACDDAWRTVVLGDLAIEAPGSAVYDVAVRGDVGASGEGAIAFDSCSGAYFDGAAGRAPRGR